jgi:CubicO group peptidase (beta-lactamase class C family)
LICVLTSSNSANEDKESLTSRLRQLRPSAEFRQHWQYNNFAYAVASMFPEHLYGISFEEYVQANIFDPLGMVDTTFNGERAFSSGRRSDAFVRKGMNLDGCMHDIDKAEIGKECQGELVNVGFLPQGAMSAGFGGIISCAKDMVSHCLLLHIRSVASIAH